MELRAGADLVGVDNAWIGGQQFGPTLAVAEVFFGQLPERIAAFYAHGFLCRGRGGTNSGLRFQRANRRSRRGRFGKNI